MSVCRSVLLCIWMSVAKMCNQFFAGHEKSQTYLKKVIINELFEFFYFFELFEFFDFFIKIKKSQETCCREKIIFRKIVLILLKFGPLGSQTWLKFTKIIISYGSTIWS